MADQYETALQTMLSGGSPATQTLGAPAPAAPVNNDTTPAPPPVVPILPDTPPVTSLDVPDQNPKQDDMILMSEEDRFELAKRQAEAAAADGGTPPPPAADGSTPPVPNQVPPGFDEVSFFTELTGGLYKTKDEVLAAINKPAEKVVEVKAPEFPNEESKKLYDALAAGKIDDVTPILEQRAFIQKLSTQAPEAILAARIKEQYPSLNDQQVQYEINRRYAVKEEDYDGDELGLSTAKTMAEDRKRIDAEEAKAYFTNKLVDIKLPDFSPAGQPASVPPAVDTESPEAKRALDFIKLLPEANPVEKLSFTFTSDSPENPITVGGDIPFPQEKITEIQNAIGDNPELYFLNRYFTKNGEFRKDVLAQDIYANSNREAIAKQVASQVLSQTQIEMLKRAKNYVPAPQTPAGGFDDAQQAATDQAWERFFGIPAKQPGSPV